jgi:dTDP-4-amino-4,6-dideoxygalactose transaminase
MAPSNCCDLTARRIPNRIEAQTASMKVPFVDLLAQYKTIQTEIDSAMAQVIKESAFIRGRFVDQFENEYAEALGINHCVSCANGTDALYIALHALGLEAGDEVITTAHSWISTSETITQAGGRVVFVDTDAATFTIDPALIEGKITERTRGIIVVHLYGQPADMEPILELARRRNLWVLEDCAQAHLARYQGKMVGTFGEIATFSFYPGKNLGAMGDAGCAVTNRAELARFMAMYARHGGLKKGDHQIEGINSRLDGLQAAILSVKLRHLRRWTEQRRAIAARYSELLGAVGDVVCPVTAANREHVFHLYVIRTLQREGLRLFLKERGIDTVLNYPVALPFLPAYAYLAHKPSDFPVAYANQSRILSLPLYAEMTEEMIRHVVDSIKAFFTRL